jgi:hypothetical protein
MPDSLETPVTLDPVVLAREIYHLERRIDGAERRIEQIDETGTRGVIGLTVQLTELTKDIGRIESELQRLQTKATASARYWLTTTLAILALLATVLIAFMR